MAGNRSSSSNFKNNFWIFDTLSHEPTFSSPERQKFDRKIRDKNLDGYDERVKESSRFRCCRKDRRQDRVFIANVFNSKSKRKAQTDLRSSPSQYVLETSKVSFNQSSPGAQFSTSKRFHGEDRYQPGLFPRPDKSRSSKVPLLFLRGQAISDDFSAIRPLQRSASLFQSQQLGSKCLEGKGASNSCISGRFPRCQPESPGSRKSNEICIKPAPFPGLVRKYRKVSFQSDKADRVPRDNLGYCLKYKEATSRENCPFKERFRNGSKTGSMVLDVRHVPDRQVRVCVISNAFRSTFYKTPAKSKSISSGRLSSDRGRGSPTGTDGLRMVDSKSGNTRRDLCSRTIGVCNYGRLRRRLGSPVGRSLFSRPLDGRPEGMAHKQKRVTCSVHSSLKFSGGGSRKSSNAPVRQQDSRVTYSKPRWYEIYNPARSDKTVTVADRELGCYSSRFLFTRPIQFDRRQSFKRKESTSGLASRRRSNENNFSKVGSSTSGPLCNVPVESRTTLCFPRSMGYTSDFHQRLQSKLGVPSSLGVPTPTSHSQSTSTPKQGVRDLPSSSTALGESILEERPKTQSFGSPIPDQQSSSAPNRPLHQLSSTTSERSSFRGLEGTGWTKLVRNLNPNDISLLQTAWRDSTWRTYGSAWKQWVTWCKQNGAESSRPQPYQVASYLGYLARTKKLAYPTILVHKSVVVTLADPSQEHHLASHPLITTMLKAINISRCASVVQKSVIWNVEDLIQWLRSHIPSNSSIYQVSRHVALLLLLASGRRIHDLTLLYVDSEHCQVSDSSITFWPKFGSKTDNVNSRQSGWHLTCSGDPALSLVKWIRCLIDVQAQRRKARKDLNNLFISSRGEVKAASRAVIANWIKVPFKDLGIDCGPGSIRSAVASNDYQHNVPLDHILLRGNWRGSVNFFKYYCKSVDRPQNANANVLNESFKVI